MRFKIFASLLLLISLSELAVAQVPSPTGGGGGSSSSSDAKFELNLFYGQTLGVNPASINQKIDDLNVGATIQMRSITKTTFRGGEAMTALSKSVLLGIRYTAQSAETLEGVEGSAKNQVKLDVQDLMGLLKYKFKMLGLDFNIGAGGGVSIVNDITITDLGSLSQYSSPGGMVMRGFMGAQYNISILSFFGELGYQSLSDKSYKTAQGVKPTSTAGDVVLDLTGPYGIFGVGFRF